MIKISKEKLTQIIKEEMESVFEGGDRNQSTSISRMVRSYAEKAEDLSKKAADKIYNKYTEMARKELVGKYLKDPSGNFKIIGFNMFADGDGIDAEIVLKDKSGKETALSSRDLRRFKQAVLK
jgi:hypothetical protein